MGGDWFSFRHWRKAGGHETFLMDSAAGHLQTASWSACSGQFFLRRHWSSKNFALSPWEGDLELVATDPCVLCSGPWTSFFTSADECTADTGGHQTWLLLPCSCKSYLQWCLTHFSLFLNNLSLGQGLKFLKRYSGVPVSQGDLTSERHPIPNHYASELGAFLHWYTGMTDIV